MSVVRPALRRLVLVELRKTTDTRSGGWLLAALILVSVGGVVLLLAFGHTDDQRFDGFLYTAQLPMGLLLPVLGILTMTSEWSQRTALTTFALVPDRRRVLNAKLLGLFALALTLVVASVGTAAVATIIASAGSGGQWGNVALIIGRVALFECLAVFVGAAFGLALLNAPGALVAFFLLPSVLTALVSLIKPLQEPVTWLDLVTNTTHLLGDDLTAGIWGRIVVSVVVWGVVPLAVGTLRVERRDIT